MDFDDAVHYGDVPVLHLEDEYLSGLNWVVTVVGKEEEVTTVERRLHTTTAVSMEGERERGREGIERGREGEREEG